VVARYEDDRVHDWLGTFSAGFFLPVADDSFFYMANVLAFSLSLLEDIESVGERTTSQSYGRKS